MPFRYSSLALFCAMRSCSYTSNIARVLDFFRIYYMQIRFLQIRILAETNHPMRFMEKSHRYIRAPCTWRFRTWSQYAIRYLYPVELVSVVSIHIRLRHKERTMYKVVSVSGRNYRTWSIARRRRALCTGAQLSPTRHCS